MSGRRDIEELFEKINESELTEGTLFNLSLLKLAHDTKGYIPEGISSNEKFLEIFRQSLEDFCISEEEIKKFIDENVDILTKKCQEKGLI